MFGFVSASGQLPEESNELLNKLGEFEKAERAKLRTLITEKRETVAIFLKAQLEERTKKGELDAALAIKEAIGSIGASDVVEVSEQLPEESAGLVEKLWEFESAREAKVGALIAGKQAAVLDLLQEQMKEETKQGRIEQAVAINEAIRSIESERSAQKKIANARSEPESRIPDDAIEHNGAHFKAYVTRTSIEWEDAREESRKLGGRLAWFDSPSDESLIRTLLEGVNEQVGHVPVWVGGLNDSEGKWNWLNGEPVDPDFWANEKDSAPNEQELAMSRWIGSFKAYQKDIPRVVGYICRWE